MQDIVVEVKGGVLVEIYSDNPDIRITVVNWDEADEGKQAGFDWPPTSLAFMPVDTNSEYSKAIGDLQPDGSIVVPASPV